jgi:hypothetical protein
MFHEAVRRCWLWHVALAASLVLIVAGSGWAQGSIDKRLTQKTTLTGEAQPLNKLLQSLCDKHRLKLDIDKAGLIEEGLDPTFPVAGLQVDGVTLGSALKLILEPHELCYSVDKGTLRIETEMKARESLVPARYPLNAFGGIDPRAIVDALQTVTFGIWQEVDGVGGRLVELSPQSLVIEQGRPAHQEIADLLERTAAALVGKRRPPTVSERAEDLIRRALARPTALPGGRRR